MTTQQPANPYRLLMTGENPFIRLSATDDGPVTTTISFWRVLFSDAGPGNVLFIQSELTEDKPRIYSDSIAMTRWLQKAIQGYLNPVFGNTDTPVVEATVKSSGDLRSSWTETVTSRDEEFSLTWSGLGEPLLTYRLPGSNPERPHGVCTVLIPANEVRVTLNGRFAKGRAWPRQRDGRAFSTCALAFAESWMLPR